MNQRGQALLMMSAGAAILVSLMFVGAVLYSERASVSRGRAQIQLYAQQAAQGAAVRLRNYYLNGIAGCPEAGLGKADYYLTPAGVPMCVPHGNDGCLPNPMFPPTGLGAANANSYICFSISPLTPSGLLSLATPVDHRDYLDMFESYFDFSAVAAGAPGGDLNYTTLPQIPGAFVPLAPTANRPAPSAICNGIAPNLTCVTVQICLTDPNCKDRNVFIQEVGFSTTCMPSGSFCAAAAGTCCNGPCAASLCP